MPHEIIEKKVMYFRNITIVVLVATVCIGIAFMTLLAVHLQMCNDSYQCCIRMSKKTGLSIQSPSGEKGSDVVVTYRKEKYGDEIETYDVAG